MANWTKRIFFAVFVKPLVLIVIGLNVRGRENLQTSGPCIIVANHNSHLDTLVLMSLASLRDLPKIRPLAAADYFMQGSRLLRWFALNCIGIIPLARTASRKIEDHFIESHAALDRGEVLVLFPEGSRGTPEKMGKLKKGIYHLLKSRPEVPVIPIRLYGLGKALPKGEALFVPFNCDVAIGEKLYCNTNREDFIKLIDQRFEHLSQYLLSRP